MPLTSKNKKHKDKDVDKLDISDNSYMKHFRILFMNNIKFLKQSYQDKDKIAVILFLSHIFYHLEQYFILNTKLKKLKIKFNL